MATIGGTKAQNVAVVSIPLKETTEAIISTANNAPLRQSLTTHLAQSDYGNETSAQIVQSLATAQTTN